LSFPVFSTDLFKPASRKLEALSEIRDDSMSRSGISGFLPPKA
jgi:hypothetical protein